MTQLNRRSKEEDGLWGGYTYHSFDPIVARLTWPYDYNRPDQEALVYPVLAVSWSTGSGGFGLWCEATAGQSGRSEYGELWGFYGRLKPIMSWQAAWFLERILSNSTGRPRQCTVKELIEATWKAVDGEYTPQVRSILARSASVTTELVDSSLNEALRQYPSPDMVSLMMENVDGSQRDDLHREVRYALEDGVYSAEDSEALSIDFGIPLLAGAV